MRTKNEVRIYAKKYRRDLADAKKSLLDAQITENLLKSEEYAVCKTLLTYISKSEETDTLIIIKSALRDGKRVAVPCCLADGIMEFYRINSLSELKTGSYGISEPICTDNPITDFRDCLMVVPALATDTKGFRVGYGKGYYDRYIEKHECPRVALCYADMVFEDVFPNVYDKKVNCIVTENGTLRINP